MAQRVGYQDGGEVDNLAVNSSPGGGYTNAVSMSELQRRQDAQFQQMQAQNAQFALAAARQQSQQPEVGGSYALLNASEKRKDDKVNPKWAAALDLGTGWNQHRVNPDWPGAMEKSWAEGGAVEEEDLPARSSRASAKPRRAQPADDPRRFMTLDQLRSHPSGNRQFMTLDQLRDHPPWESYARGGRVRSSRRPKQSRQSASDPTQTPAQDFAASGGSSLTPSQQYTAYGYQGSSSLTPSQQYAAYGHVITPRSPRLNTEQEFPPAASSSGQPTQEREETGYAKGGAVEPQDDDTVYAGTGAKWSPESYEASLRKSYQRSDPDFAVGYAAGGAVARSPLQQVLDHTRRQFGLDTIGKTAGYAEGGEVEEDTNYADQEVLRQEQERQQELARQQAEEAAIPDTARSTEGTIPPNVPVPGKGSRERLGDILGLRGREGQERAYEEGVEGWGGRLDPVAPVRNKDEFVPGSKPTATTGKPTSVRSSVEIPPEPLTAESDLGALVLGGGKKLLGDIGSGISGAASTAGRAVADTASTIGSNVAAGVSKDYASIKDALAGYIKGERGHPPDHVAQLYADQAKSNPGGTHNEDTQKIFDAFLARNDFDGASRMVQSLREPYNNARSVGIGALQHGDVDSAIKAFQNAHNLMPNGKDINLSRNQDGTISAKLSTGESFTLSHKQFKDWAMGSGSDFDHVADNGIEKNLGIAAKREDPYRPSFELGQPITAEQAAQAGYYVPPGMVVDKIGGPAYRPRDVTGRGGSSNDMGGVPGPTARDQGPYTDSGRFPINSPLGRAEQSGRTVPNGQQGTVEVAAPQGQSGRWFQTSDGRTIPMEDLLRGGKPAAQTASEVTRPKRIEEMSPEEIDRHEQRQKLQDIAQGRYDGLDTSIPWWQQPRAGSPQARDLEWRRQQRDQDLGERPAPREKDYGISGYAGALRASNNPQRTLREIQGAVNRGSDRLFGEEPRQPAPARQRRSDAPAQDRTGYANADDAELPPNARLAEGTVPPNVPTPQGPQAPLRGADIPVRGSESRAGWTPEGGLRQSPAEPAQAQYPPGVKLVQSSDPNIRVIVGPDGKVIANVGTGQKPPGPDEVQEMLMSRHLSEIEQRARRGDPVALAAQKDPMSFAKGPLEPEQTATEQSRLQAEANRRREARGGQDPKTFSDYELEQRAQGRPVTRKPIEFVQAPQTTSVRRDTPATPARVEWATRVNPKTGEQTRTPHVIPGTPAHPDQASAREAAEYGAAERARFNAEATAAGGGKSAAQQDLHERRAELARAAEARELTANDRLRLQDIHAREAAGAKMTPEDEAFRRSFNARVDQRIARSQGQQGDQGQQGAPGTYTPPPGKQWIHNPSTGQIILWPP